MIESIQMKLTIEIEIAELADLLGLDDDEIVRLWDKGDLHQHLDTFAVLELLNEIGALDDYGGLEVGSGFR